MPQVVPPQVDPMQLLAIPSHPVLSRSGFVPVCQQSKRFPSRLDIRLVGSSRAAEDERVRSQVSSPLQNRSDPAVWIERNPAVFPVWGTLKGASDETIFLIAHRDGWFDAAGDNASGVASIISLAEHYAKIPQAQRRRTFVFVGLDGHHNSGPGAGVGRRWMWDNRQTLLNKTALMINAEHPSTIQTTVRGRYYPANDTIAWSNTHMPQQWYAGGPSRRKLETIAVNAFREFGASMYFDPNPRPPAGDLGAFFRGVPGVATSEFYHYFHTDQETPETVPWTGLEATTRAYAKIIDEVNKLDLTDLQRREEPAPATTKPTVPVAPKQ